MWARIANIWRKETRDSYRDAKSIIAALLVPILMGAFYAALNPLLTNIIRDRAREPLVIAAQGSEYADPLLVQSLAQFDITLAPFAGDLRAAVTNGEEKAGLIIPSGFADQVSAQRQAQLTLLLNTYAGGIFGGGFSNERLELAINSYSQQVAASRLAERGIDQALVAPVALDAQDLSTPAQRAGIFAALMMPILLGSIIAQGGMFSAIDSTAGEKERGTLEALLVTPARDFEVLLGKIAAVFTVTCVPLVLTFVSFWATYNLLPASFTLGAVLPFEVAAGAVLVGLPLVLLISGGIMIVSIRTKTFKDAQTAAAPIFLAVIGPGMAAAFLPPGNLLFYLIPVYGPSAVVGLLATGSAVPVDALLLAIGGTLLADAIVLIIAMRLFDRERLVYSI